MKKPTFRRVMAFIVDALIVALITSMFSRLSIINPTGDKYEEYSKEYMNYISELSQSEDPSEFNINNKSLQDLSYNISYYGVYSSIITLVISFLYYSIFQYYTGGKTLGKLLFGIKVISTKDEKLNLVQIIIRSAIINSLLTSSILIIMILLLSKNSFLKVNNIIQIIDTGLIFASFAMILYKNDGVGLHDLLASTAVVNSYESFKDYKEVYLDVKNAEYKEVDNKEEEKKVTKKKTKKGNE